MPLQWGRNLSVAEGCWSGRRLPITRGCFNGAATFRLRKVPGIVLDPFMGAGFNGAATFRLRKACSECGEPMSDELQWGRNLSVAEGQIVFRCRACRARFNGAATFRLRKVEALEAGLVERHASMGPQPFGCGRRSACPKTTAAETASMGPQPFGCGRPTLSSTLNIHSSLQWGRNLSVAEGARRDEGATGHSRLQWGRNLSVAEGPYGFDLIMLDFGFNGAATFRLRKGRRGPAPRRHGRSFNGAATFRLRKGQRPTCQRALAISFNGAATFRLRKEHGRRRHVDARVASMGPQPFGCGRPMRWSTTSKISALQWGRNLSVAEGPAARSTTRARPCCFNGAATFRLRKERGLRLAQRGRQASMGPQPFGCGRRAGHAAPSWRPRGFNGAATFRLRKGAGRSMAAPRAAPLQWGRNLSVAEGNGFWEGVRLIDRLQWGRNLSVAEGAG